MGEGQNVKRPQLRHAMPAECQVKQDSKPKFGVEKVTFPLQFCMFVAFIGVFLTSCGFFFFFTFVVFGHQTKRHFWALGPLQWHKAFLKPKFPSKRWLTLQARSTSPPARLFTKTHKQTIPFHSRGKHFFRLLAAPPAAALLGNRFCTLHLYHRRCCVQHDNGGIARRMAPETYTRATAAMI